MDARRRMQTGADEIFDLMCIHDMYEIFDLLCIHAKTRSFS